MYEHDTKERKYVQTQPCDQEQFYLKTTTLCSDITSLSFSE